MNRMTLTVMPRTLLGKKVKQLRREGTIPGHIFGYQTEPINVAVNNVDLLNTYQEAGDTGLVDLILDSKTYPVLIQNIQIHPITNQFLNVDFHKVNLKEKVTVSIPVVQIGESPAVTSNIGVIDQPVNEIEIEALPADLIDEVAFDISKLTDIDQEVFVSDLLVPATVTILTEPETLVMKVGPLVTADMQATLEAAEAVTEAAQAEEAAEGEVAAAEGEEKTAEDKSEQEPSEAAKEPSNDE